MTTDSSPPLHRHTAFGLEIASALGLPELLAGREEGEAEVVIEFGVVGEAPSEALKRGVRFAVGADWLWLQVDGVARFWVEGGRRIVIDRAEGADDDDLRVFLLAGGMGAILHQRGDLVLHGSVVEWEGEAVVFLGRSGAGKSTLASAFHARGRRVLTDDLCVVRKGADGRMEAWPSFPQAKLWGDALQLLGVSAEGLRRIRSKLEKRALPLGEGFAAEPRAVRRLYVLQPINNLDEVGLARCQGPMKFEHLRRHTYRIDFLAAVEAKAKHLRQALALAAQAELVMLRRPRGGATPDAVVARVEADLAEPTGGAEA